MFRFPVALGPTPTIGREPFRQLRRSSESLLEAGKLPTEIPGRKSTAPSVLLAAALPSHLTGNTIQRMSARTLHDASRNRPCYRLWPEFMPRPMPRHSGWHDEKTNLRNPLSCNSDHSMRWFAVGRRSRHQPISQVRLEVPASSPRPLPAAICWETSTETD